MLHRVFIPALVHRILSFDVLEEAIRLPGESPAYMIVLNSQRGESIDIVCICRMLRDT